MIRLLPTFGLVGWLGWLGWLVCCASHTFTPFPARLQSDPPLSTGGRTMPALQVTVRLGGKTSPIVLDTDARRRGRRRVAQSAREEDLSDTEPSVPVSAKPTCIATDGLLHAAPPARSAGRGAQPARTGLCALGRRRAVLHADHLPRHSVRHAHRALCSRPGLAVPDKEPPPRTFAEPTSILSSEMNRQSSSRHLGSHRPRQSRWRQASGHRRRRSASASNTPREPKSAATVGEAACTVRADMRSPSV